MLLPIHINGYESIINTGNDINKRASGYTAHLVLLDTVHCLAEVAVKVAVLMVSPARHDPSKTVEDEVAEVVDALPGQEDLADLENHQLGGQTDPEDLESLRLGGQPALAGQGIHQLGVPVDPEALENDHQGGQGDLVGLGSQHLGGHVAFVGPENVHQSDQAALVGPCGRMDLLDLGIHGQVGQQSHQLEASDRRQANAVPVSTANYSPVTAAMLAIWLSGSRHLKPHKNEKNFQNCHRIRKPIKYCNVIK